MNMWREAFVVDENEKEVILIQAANILMGSSDLHLDTFAYFRSRYTSKDLYLNMTCGYQGEIYTGSVLMDEQSSSLNCPRIRINGGYLRWSK